MAIKRTRCDKSISWITGKNKALSLSDIGIAITKTTNSKVAYDKEIFYYDDIKKNMEVAHLCLFIDKYNCPKTHLKSIYYDDTKFSIQILPVTLVVNQPDNLANLLAGIDVEKLLSIDAALINTNTNGAIQASVNIKYLAKI